MLTSLDSVEGVRLDRDVRLLVSQAIGWVSPLAKWVGQGCSPRDAFRVLGNLFKPPLLICPIDIGFDG